MKEKKYAIDIFLVKFQKFLPKHLQPQAFKIVFGVFVACVMALIAWSYNIEGLLVIVIGSGIIFGAVAVFLFLKWLFTGRF